MISKLYLKAASFVTLAILTTTWASAYDAPNAYDIAIKLFHQGEPKKAFSIADDLIKEKKSEPWGYRLRAELNHEQGRDDLAKQDTQKAVDIAIKLFELDKDQAPVAGSMRVKSMSEITAQTRAIDNSFSTAMSDADKALIQKQPKFDMAEIQKAIARNPRDFHAVFKQAAAYQQTGDWKAALKAFGKALSLEAKLLK